MINLFVNYYIDTLPERQKEIDSCLLKNIQNENIGRIIVFISNDCQLPIALHSNKITQVIHNERLTYMRFFQQTQSYPNDINILANSDIYFDSTLIETLLMSKDSCYALRRYEVQHNGNIEPFHLGGSVSQDVWIFNGNVKYIEDCDFSLGIGGCDNRIAFLIQQAGYKITNPCTKIKTYHLHLVQKRDWQSQPPIPGSYLELRPE